MASDSSLQTRLEFRLVVHGHLLLIVTIDKFFEQRFLPVRHLIANEDFLLLLQKLQLASSVVSFPVTPSLCYIKRLNRTSTTSVKADTH